MEKWGQDVILPAGLGCLPSVLTSVLSLLILSSTVVVGGYSSLSPPSYSSQTFLSIPITSTHMASTQATGDTNTVAPPSASPNDAQHLPSAFFDLPHASSNFTMASPGRGFGDYIRRMRHWAQMDWELTMWQMVYLCVQPTKVYNTTKYHKQTKNQWARDDPGFVVLLVLLLVMAVVAWCLAFRSPGQIPKMVVYVVVVDFVLLSVVVATINWLISNRFMSSGSNLFGSNAATRASSAPSSFLVKQRVEWLYAFDVHCNSFFPAFLILHVLQFLLLPLILHMPSFVSTIISNLIFLLAFSYYHYITCLGFTALPFLSGTQSFLLPIPILVCAFCLSLPFQFNLSLWFLSFYFPAPLP